MSATVNLKKNPFQLDTLKAAVLCRKIFVPTRSKFRNESVFGPQKTPSKIHKNVLCLNFNAENPQKSSEFFSWNQVSALTP